MTKNQHIAQIAKEHLHIETLETRSSDSLDFHSVAVWQVAKALDAAYRAAPGPGSDLLAAAEKLLAAKDNQMETIVEWRALRRAVKNARKNA